MTKENKKFGRRDFLLGGGSSLLLASTLSTPALSKNIRRLNMVTTWPKNLPGLGTSPERIAKRISAATDGKLNIKVFSAGELVPAFGAFDAASSGLADMYNGAEYYWQGKNIGFNFFTAVPFGMTANELNAWIDHGGGQELWNELTSDFNLYKKIKRIRFYGIETVDRKNKFLNSYYSNENGVNSRLDEIQSSILNFKLKKVDTFIKRRNQLAKIYLKELSLTNLVLPTKVKNRSHVYHLFTIYHPKAKLIIRHLKNRKIETRVIYPHPIHKMKAYKEIKHNRMKLINSEIKSKGIICLPLYPELQNKEVKFICKNLIDVLKKI